MAAGAMQYAIDGCVWHLFCCKNCSFGRFILIEEMIDIIYFVLIVKSNVNRIVFVTTPQLT